MNTATQNLMTTAQSTESQNHAAKRAASSTMDYNFTTLQTLTSDLTTAQTSAANIASPIVYNNNCLTKTNCNNDEDSALDQGLSKVNTAMPAPGGGTNNAGDSPQEVLFIVSDGLVDENVASGGNCGSSTRTCAGINTLANWCTTIKNRGIRIAFLYTTYYPLTTNAFYNSYISSFQSNVATERAGLRLAGAVLPGRHRRQHLGRSADPLSEGGLHRATDAIAAPKNGILRSRAAGRAGEGVRREASSCALAQEARQWEGTFADHLRAGVHLNRS